jgi:hypothetical protein
LPIIPPVSGDIYYIEVSGNHFITDALDLLGQNDVNDTPEAAIITRDLRTLNMMLDAWNTEKLIPYAMTQFTGTLVASTVDYEMGDSSAFDSAMRPVKIQNGEAWIVRSGVEYPLTVVDEAQWEALQETPALSGMPQYVLYELGPITGTFSFYPTPDAADTFVLWQRVLLAQIQDATTIYYLPQGYAEAITNHLAIRLAPKYGKPVPQEVSEVATNAKAAIKRNNMKPQTMASDTALLGPGYADIYSGTVR